MPTNATQRAYLSDLLAGTSTYEDDTKTNFHYASVNVGGSTTIGQIGIPVIWVNGNTQFEVYVAQSIATAISTGGSPLPDGSVIGIVVGDNFGLGYNKADINLASGDVNMTVLYRGDATILNGGMVWGSADATAQGLFLAQLQKQRITTIASATTVTPSYAGV